MLSRRVFVCLFFVFFANLVARPAIAQSASSLAGDIIRISRIDGRIAIDGDLNDEAWQRATRVEKWYEINPGDNIEPSVRSVGYLGYDDKFFYAAFEFDDPDPAGIRAPLGDRDNVPGFTDYGGIILDTRGDGQRAQMMLVNPRGIQYDAITGRRFGGRFIARFFLGRGREDHVERLDARDPRPVFVAAAPAKRTRPATSERRSSAIRSRANLGVDVKYLPDAAHLDRPLDLILHIMYKLMCD